MPNSRFGGAVFRMSYIELVGTPLPLVMSPVRARLVRVSKALGRGVGSIIMAMSVAV